jgi:hypothetical protein
VDHAEVDVTNALPLRFEFTTLAAPVQAEGTIAGKPFYFRARGTEWAFTVSMRPGGDPAMLEPEDVVTGDAWYRSGTVPGPFGASWMPIARATELIRECALAYVNERVEKG